jgi:hypothetical protein
MNPETSAVGMTWPREGIFAMRYHSESTTGEIYYRVEGVVLEVLDRRSLSSRWWGCDGVGQTRSKISIYDQIEQAMSGSTLHRQELAVVPSTTPGQLNANHGP